MEVAEKKYTRYDAYKDSGLDWLGELPFDWKVKRLKYVSHVQFSNVDKHTIDGEQEVRLVNYTDVYKNEQIHPEMEFMVASATQAEIEKFWVEPGDVIITKDSESPSDIAVPAYVEDSEPDMICGYHLSILKPSNQLDGKFLMRCFQSGAMAQQFEVAAKGVTRFAIGKADIGNGLFPIPPIEEQQAIAKWLDTETARVDALVAKKQRFIGVLKEKRAALISRAVTRGIDPNAKLKDTGIPWLGEVPAHWELSKLRYLGQTQNGVSKGGEYFGSGFPFLTYGDVYNNPKLTDSCTGLAESTESDQELYSVLEGDVFFTRTSETIDEIGLSATCFETIEQAIFSGFIIRFRPTTDRLTKEYSRFFFRSDILRSYFEREMLLVTRASLSQDLLKSLPVLLPPIDEQIRIYEWLDAETSRIDEMLSRSEGVIEKLHEYRKAIISAAVTGKIKVS